jgi:putative peptidoglycan lipid II flippase
MNQGTLPIPKLVRISGLLAAGISTKVLVDAIIAALFGLSLRTDALFVGITVPLMLEAIVYQTCQSVLVPVITRSSASQSALEASAVTASLFNLAAILSVALAAIGIATATIVVPAIAPGMSNEGIVLAVLLNREFYLSTVLVGPIAVMKAILNAHSRFYMPAIGEAARGVTVLIVLVVSQQILGPEAVPLGYFLGGGVALALLAVTASRKKYFRYRPVLSCRLLRSLSVGKLLSLQGLDYLVLQFVLVGERVVGSFLPPGSITAIAYGHRLASVLGYSLFTGVEIISMSAMAATVWKAPAAGNDPAKQILESGLRLVIIVGIPAMLLIWMMKLDLVGLIFRRGAFDMDAAGIVAPVIGVYCLSLPFYGCMLLTRNFNAATYRVRKNLVASTVCVCINIPVSAILSCFLGPLGPAIAYLAGYAAFCICSLSGLETVAGERGRRLKALGSRVIAASLLMIVPAVFARNASVYCTTLICPKSYVFAEGLAIASVTVTGVVSVLAFLRAMKIPEVSAFTENILSSVGKGCGGR